MGWVVNTTHGGLYPRGGGTRYQFVQETGWDPGPVCTGAKNLIPPPGFDPRTFRPLVSLYTGYALPAHLETSAICF